MDEQPTEDWRQMEEQLTDGEKAEKEEKNSLASVWGVKNVEMV